MSIRRRIWERRIRNFWEDFSHNKIGLLGLAIIIAYVLVAVMTPVLAPVDPEQRSVAEPYAYPEWYANLVPALQNLPRTTDILLDWRLENKSLPDFVTVEPTSDGWTIRYNNGTTPVQILFVADWNYTSAPPKSFDFTFSYAGNPGKPVTTWYSLGLDLTTPPGGNKTSALWGDTYPIWDAYWWRFSLYDKQMRYDKIHLTYPSYPFLKFAAAGTVDLVPMQEFDRLGYERQDYYTKMLPDLFGPPGEFNFKMNVAIKPAPGKTNTTCEISISKFGIHIPGLAYGLLGTQVYGCDCWSRLIYGVKISLAVGLMAAVLSTSIGILVGVTAGFMGGLIDELLMRVVDVLLCLPALPILIVLVALFGRSVWYIVLIIAIFGWQGLARIIRSQTLSIRETSFIESAEASGGSKSYIMSKHVVPNVMPIALADMVLSIPGAIILEAALSFIGFGDPTTSTWGREFNLAFSEGSGFSQFVWWWVVPPGIAITLLCLAFVFVSHAIDEIVNPRLRRRR
jgi:ABC-type dipeptide/oligopeptide/nickel transport system permease subunit